MESEQEQYEESYTEATTREVPLQYKCPVCGKWGRRAHSLDYRGWGYSYYYCNPKARKGGKGCGERFRYIEPYTGCVRINNHLLEFIHKETKTERMIALGFELVQFAKTNGTHRPFERKVLNRVLYGPYLESKKAEAKCPCGCGNELKMNDRGQIERFAHYTCPDMFYRVSEMITNQGEGLRKFLADLRGCRCEQCQQSQQYISALEVDHIVEVNEGGGMCWIDNYQLLCADCHKDKTKVYAGVRAERARAEKEAMKPIVPPMAQLSLF